MSEITPAKTQNILTIHIHIRIHIRFRFAFTFDSDYFYKFSLARTRLASYQELLWMWIMIKNILEMMRCSIFLFRHSISIGTSEISNAFRNLSTRAYRSCFSMETRVTDSDVTMEK